MKIILLLFKNVIKLKLKIKIFNNQLLLLIKFKIIKLKIKKYLLIKKPSKEIRNNLKNKRKQILIIYLGLCLNVEDLI